MRLIDSIREVAMSDMFIVVSVAFVADMITGHIKAVLTKTPSSALSFDGLLRNTLRVFGVLIGCGLAVFMHAPDFVYNSLMGLTIAGYGLSILENYTASDIAVPQFLKDMFEEYYNKYNKGDKD